MKPCYVSGLEASQLITSSFLVYSKEVREKKTGEPYLSLLLADKTGRIDAKMWDNVPEVLAAFDRDDFVKVKALVQIHQNRPQLTIHKIRRLEDTEVEFVDFYPCSSRDVDSMWSELLAIAGDVKNPHLRALLQAFLTDDEIAVRFRRAPAAKTIHHAFLGGLLEHVLSLCMLSRSVAGHYAHIDVDLLLTGAILHDVGKVYELTYDRGFGYSVEGQLLGHIPLGFRMLSDKLRNLPDFPERLRTLVEHMILSHHGQLEFGSPRVPLFAEAMLFHYLDDMDSKMECMRNLVENDRTGDHLFTGYSSPLQRAVLRKQAFLQQPGPVENALAENAPAASAVPNKADTVAQAQPSSSPFASKLLDALREN